MTGMAQGVLLVYGVLMLVGGVMGYATSKSMPSLIAGIISGILLLGAWGLAQKQPKAGLSVGAVTAAVLIVVFLRRYLETQKVMPSLMLLGVSVLSCVVMAIAAFKLQK